MGSVVMNKKNKAILIVDDDPLMLRSVQKVLSKAFDEFSILTALSGAACLEIATAEQPEMILLDVNMPDMDGFDTCKHLRAAKETKHIPILMMTGEKLESSRKAAGLCIGADAYLFKPFGNAELIAQVQVILRIKHDEDILRAQKESLKRVFRDQITELQQSKEILEKKLNLLEKQIKEKII
jgi:DNA-binding response OmpR family regulator